MSIGKHEVVNKIYRYVHDNDEEKAIAVLDDYIHSKNRAVIKMVEKIKDNVSKILEPGYTLHSLDIVIKDLKNE